MTSSPRPRLQLLRFLTGAALIVAVPRRRLGARRSPIRTHPARETRYTPSQTLPPPKKTRTAGPSVIVAVQLCQKGRIRAAGRRAYVSAPSSPRRHMSPNRSPADSSPKPPRRCLRLRPSALSSSGSTAHSARFFESPILRSIVSTRRILTSTSWPHPRQNQVPDRQPQFVERPAGGGEDALKSRVLLGVDRVGCQDQAGDDPPADKDPAREYDHEAGERRGTGQGLLGSGALIGQHGEEGILT